MSYLLNSVARTVAALPLGSRFRINNILYTKVGEATEISTFRVLTFRNGKQKEISLTVYKSDTYTYVDPGKKAD